MYSVVFAHTLKSMLSPDYSSSFSKDLDLSDIFMRRLGSVSLFNGISTLFRLVNAKSILLEEQ